MKEKKEANEIPTQGDIRDIALKIKNLQDRALFVFSYLTGGRANEIVGSVKKKDIDFITSNDREILLITMPNLKNRTRRYKKLPIPLDKEGELVSILKEYLDKLDDEDVLFPFSSRTGRDRLKGLCGFDFRYMRHIRLTHLVSLYDFNEQLLVRFAGWTDSRPARHYMELRWIDFLSKM